ncbi:MAG: UvrD-helicase domain-containing protein [Sphingobacteriaceae bacterium]|nr:UvrD-helicase domain-containing protein [Sphingobacteriaceae bacterium]
MDKSVIFAVAGSGKTTHIINQLNLTDPVLIVTYTTSNLDNIRTSILKKFGYFPANIKLLSYFTFIHSFCYKPFLTATYRTKGIFYKPNANNYAKNEARYITNGGRLYSNRISKFLQENKVLDDINARLKKYYKYLYIDEIQDFAGNDFNFIKSLAKADINILMVGDFYQHTFDTSRDGIVNKTLHDDYAKYQAQFAQMGLKVDTTTLNKSYRCSPTVCEFITKSIGINIESHRTDAVSINVVSDESEAQTILSDNEIIKLFYQKHYAYNCYSKNWGDCKGEDKYNTVCVVLNRTTQEKFSTNTLRDLPAVSKNKLYVACSRPKRDLYFVPESNMKKIDVN